MLKHLKDALVEKIEEQRAQDPYCTIRWKDTKQFEVIPQRYISLPPLQELEDNLTYAVTIDGTKRYGTVLAHGNIN
ncbi:unnamed protein product [Rotaria sp. Silwood2]|nr:unnamed protein product [Rotaria sp. Silwood2]CAF2749121.1 unnamed protein product [Rotaria sp. Silwood2]CAF4152387.1 unnamed protein product [Rotaria sp. Silwood2]CAF4275826.1 unnamed protein product [Rotaria sp. Silwood2]